MQNMQTVGATPYTPDLSWLRRAASMQFEHTNLCEADFTEHLKSWLFKSLLGKGIRILYESEYDDHIDYMPQDSTPSWLGGRSSASPSIGRKLSTAQHEEMIGQKKQISMIDIFLK